MHTTAHPDPATEQAPAEAPAGSAAPHRLRTAARLLLALHLLLLAWSSLRPLPVSWTYPPNLTPFASVHQALAVGGLAGARQLAAGLLPLAPVGVLLPLAFGGADAPWLPSFLRTTGAVALLATALEIAEGWAPGHVLNVDDILLGTLGAAVAHLALVPLLRRLALRHRPAVHLPAPRPERRALPGTAARPAVPALTSTGPQRH
ncbi:VanZ family protein [Kitasatospora sp. NPDC049285]|uniref:VanZ family protein n=1 Tax=Kitasatospora sp. NPDC049285 TaxID=3157096 RepID=UPI003443D1DF